MSKEIMSKSVRAYLRRIGAKGGEAKGKAKLRGGSAHYRAMAKRRWARPGPGPGSDDLT